MTSDVRMESETPVHDFFELSYSQYQVLDRTILQSMPVDWQKRFVAVMEELQQAARDLPSTAYKVESGKWHYPSDLTESEVEAQGWAYNQDDRSEVFDPEGNAYSAHRQCLFIPCPSPIPLYERGRARVPLHPIEDAADD